jgi:hypothetical protein
LYEPGDEEYLHRGSINVDLIVDFSLTLSKRYNINEFKVENLDIYSFDEKWQTIVRKKEENQRSILFYIS